MNGLNQQEFAEYLARRRDGEIPIGPLSEAKYSVLKIIRERKYVTPSFLTGRSGCTHTNTSMHLRSMRDDGLIGFEMFGKNRMYFLTNFGKEVLDECERIARIKKEELKRQKRKKQNDEIFRKILDKESDDERVGKNDDIE